MTSPKPKILLVDDEPQILEGLGRGLRSSLDVRTAHSGPLGLEVLAREPDIAIIMSDMRMPVMNGTAFLAKAKALAPDTVRLLLTGQADMEDAIGAINEGNIFRFLKKPCPPDLMRAALGDAVKQHRLIMAERLLLEQTLRGAVQTLCDTLALANHEIFGLGMRVKRVASNLAAKVGGTPLWQIEVAAMLCQLGAMTIPPAVHERRVRGEVLVPSEREMFERVPAVTDQLLAHIPRLEAVRDIIRHSRAGFDFNEATDSQSRTGFDIPFGARILKVALDFEELKTAGLSPDKAIERMRSQAESYDAVVLDALEELYVKTETTIIEIPVTRLLEGMIIGADVVTKNGTLLVARGHEVTPGLVRRLENFGASLGQETVQVIADMRHQPLRRIAA
ncbi:MAG TPA: HD domain-containing phosphohydrolase [Labilithrix sp.]|nr:HD domain-containing phosphohydrolase [Labilithrix sp.]